MPEIVLQPGAAAGIDTRLDESAPNTSRGADTTSTWGFGTTDNSDAMFKFDLSSISKGSKIQEAILSLWVTSDTGPVTNTVIWRILSGNSAWVEGATWNKLDGAAANWAGSAGCETEAVDISPALLYGPVNKNLAGVPLWIDFDLNPSEFQALIDVGNYGFKLGSLDRDSGVTRDGVFSSSDHGTAVQHPKLYVRWIEPSGRLFEYKFNKFDAKKEILDPMGNIVDLNEVRPDRWIFTEGFDLPSGIAYGSLVVDPRMSYIVGVTYNEDGQVLAIETDRNQFADAIIQRLTRGV